MGAKVDVIHEVASGAVGDWSLCFQWVRYNYDEKSSEMGYRFIWKSPDGNLRPQKGQARIPGARDIFSLLQKAAEAGWFVTCESENKEVEDV